MQNVGKGIGSTSAVGASSEVESWFYCWIDGRAVQRQHDGDAQASSSQTIARPLEVRNVSDSPASQVRLLLNCIGGTHEANRPSV